MPGSTSWGSRLFDWSNATLLLLFAVSTVLPFIYIIAASLSDPVSLIGKDFVIFPEKFSLAAYKYIFSTDTLLRSLLASVYITIVGTFINLLFTALTAYALSHQNLDGRRVMMIMIIFVMLFEGGMIPSFLIVKSLGLINTYWALFLPSAISSFNMIVMRSFFSNIPVELKESGKIDGCNDFGILFRIILPLSMPVLATFALFYAVAHWNTFFSAILYINDTKKWPIQVLLNQILIGNKSDVGDVGFDRDYVLPPPQTVKMAVIVIATMPIMTVYPFLQKHFVKGLMLGSVKG